MTSPQTPNLTWNKHETNILNIVLLEKSLKIKIYRYPYGGIYKYINVPSEEALPPCLKYAQASLVSAMIEILNYSANPLLTNEECPINKILR